MKVDNLDHLVLAVADIERACVFYEAVLGVEHVAFEGRNALRFGSRKIDLHQKDDPCEPKARHPLRRPAPLRSAPSSRIPEPNMPKSC